jgi:hypothetical protein
MGPVMEIAAALFGRQFGESSLSATAVLAMQSAAAVQKMNLIQQNSPGFDHQLSRERSDVRCAMPANMIGELRDSFMCDALDAQRSLPGSFEGSCSARASTMESRCQRTHEAMPTNL